MLLLYLEKTMKVIFKTSSSHSWEWNGFLAKEPHSLTLSCLPGMCQGVTEPSLGNPCTQLWTRARIQRLGPALSTQFHFGVRRARPTCQKSRSIPLTHPHSPTHAHFTQVPWADRNLRQMSPDPWRTRTQRSNCETHTLAKNAAFKCLPKTQI